MNSIHDLFSATQALRGMEYRMMGVRTNIYFGNLKCLNGQYYEVIHRDMSTEANEKLEKVRNQEDMLFGKASQGSNFSASLLGSRTNSLTGFDTEAPVDYGLNRFSDQNYNNSQDLERALNYLEETARTRGA